jgi:hypothetical protein
MDSSQKLFEHVMLKRGDANVSFSELCRLLCRLGFSERNKGGHHIFTMGGIEEIINLQPIGGKAKAYRVTQVRGIVLRHNLKLGE